VKHMTYAYWRMFHMRDILFSKGAKDHSVK